MMVRQGALVCAAARRTRISSSVWVLKGPVYLPGGGDLIISIDDQVVKTFDDVLVYLESFKSPGETVTLTVLRPARANSNCP